MLLPSSRIFCSDPDAEGGADGQIGGSREGGVWMPDRAGSVPHFLNFLAFHRGLVAAEGIPERLSDSSPQSQGLEHLRARAERENPVRELLIAADFRPLKE